MNKILLVPIILIFGLLAYFMVLAHSSKSGKAPGLTAGKLNPCAKTSNCVCSDHEQGAIPLYIAYDINEDTIETIKITVENMGGVLQQEQPDYLAYTFSSGIFGFVDDLEIRIDRKTKFVHFRSASRVGTSDFGVNKERAETLRDKLDNKLI